MKLIKYIIGALLIPLAIGFSRSFYDELLKLDDIGPKLNFFIWGIVIYMLMHLVLFRPTYLHALGHESIHALATWLCGGHITSFSISGSGGSVTTSKTNFFIELSPYFIPTYTVILILIAPLIKNKLVENNWFPFYIFALGFTLGMHLIMTADSLKIKQPDVLKSGFLFSYLFIYVGNLIIVFLIFSLLMKGASFKIYFFKGLDYSINMYSAVTEKLLLRFFTK